MSLTNHLLLEAKSISVQEFKKRSPEIAQEMGYDYKYPEAWVIKQMSSVFYFLFRNEKGGYNYKLLQKYVPTLKELFPFRGTAYRALTIDIPTFGRLYSVIKREFSEDQKKPFKILLKYARGEIKKSKEIEDAFNKAVKLYIENTIQFRSVDFDSWAKSTNGIKYFKRHQHGNHNVIIKANVEGLDLLSMLDFINEYYGKNIFGDKYRHTKNVEEVVAPTPDSIEIVDSRVLKKMKPKPKPTAGDFL